MPFPKKLRILVAPLDWGLGHTTRCIPIIEALLKRGVEVIVAGNEIQEKILVEEFPDCAFLPLDGYGVAYSRSKKGFLFKMMQQLPHIASVVKQEQGWLQKAVADNVIDGIISDNRFGLYHQHKPSIFITHQLQIKTGMGSLADNIARFFNYRYINKYSRVWIPDFEGPRNLGGDLSHPSLMPATPTTYVGALSRISSPSTANENGPIVFIFSGPEPQRSIFEQEVFKQLKTIQQRQVVIIKGKPLLVDVPSVNNATVYNHLPKSEMEAIMRSAKMIICRSGYSSVMDINAMGQRSILIPTPGQTEQEYLADYLMQKKFAVSGDPADFNLLNLLQEADHFSYQGFIQPDSQLLANAVDVFLTDCANRRQV